VSERKTELQRWVDRSPGGDALEEHAAALFRRVDVPVPFTPPDPPASGAPASGAGGGAGSGLARLVRLRPLALVTAAGSVVGVALLALSSGEPPRRPAPAAPATPAAAPAMPQPIAAAPLPPPAESENTALSVRRPELARSRRLSVRAAVPERRREPPPAPPPPPAPAAPVPAAGPDEAALLEGALVQLRQQRDGAGALAALDEHRRLFPDGAYAREAALARVDALLVLRRTREALSALEALSLNTSGREGELRLIRAELRAQADCRRGLEDFIALQDAVLPDQLTERALYGQVVCQQRLGQRDQLERAGRAYLSAFPSGRFAGDVRRRLQVGR
jgi:hypothetical protein